MKSPIKKTKRDERLEQEEEQEKLRKRVREKDKTFASPEEEEEERGRDDEETRKVHMEHMLETKQWTDPDPEHVKWMKSPIKKTKRDMRLDEEEDKAEMEAAKEDEDKGSAKEKEK